MSSWTRMNTPRWKVRRNTEKQTTKQHQHSIVSIYWVLYEALIVFLSADPHPEYFFYFPMLCSKYPVARYGHAAQCLMI